MKTKICRILNKISSLVVASLVALAATPVYAAGVSAISDTMTRQKISTASSHSIVFTISASNTVAANETITIDFGEDSSYFAVDGAGTTTSDITFNDGTARTVVGVDGLCTGHNGVNDIAAGINDTTGVLTMTACGTYTASSTGATVTLKYGTAAGGTDRVTNPAAKGTYIIPIAGTFGDTGKFAVSIPEASGDDQIPVTATVNPSITFTVVNTTLALGDISTSGGTFAGPNNISIGTNANSGYTITVQDEGSGASDGLYSSGVSQLIDSNDADLASVPGYGGQCLKSSGDGACGANYPTTAGTSVGDFTRTTQTFASYGSKPSGTDTFQIKVGARVSTSQEAGYYVDTLTLLATGNF